VRPSLILALEKGRKDSRTVVFITSGKVSFFFPANLTRPSAAISSELASPGTAKRVGREGEGGRGGYPAPQAFRLSTPHRKKAGRELWKEKERR